MLHIYYYCIIIAAEIDMSLMVAHWRDKNNYVQNINWNCTYFLFSNIYISLGNSLPRGEIPPDRTDNPDDTNRFLAGSLHRLRNPVK